MNSLIYNDYRQNKYDQTRNFIQYGEKIGKSLQFFKL